MLYVCVCECECGVQHFYKYRYRCLYGLLDVCAHCGAFAACCRRRRHCRCRGRCRGRRCLYKCGF